jgi:hypothetical protein
MAMMATVLLLSLLLVQMTMKLLVLRMSLQPDVKKTRRSLTLILATKLSKIELMASQRQQRQQHMEAQSGRLLFACRWQLPLELLIWQRLVVAAC